MMKIMPCNLGIDVGASYFTVAALVTEGESEGKVVTRRFSVDQASRDNTMLKQIVSGVDALRSTGLVAQTLFLCTTGSVYEDGTVIVGGDKSERNNRPGEIFTTNELANNVELDTYNVGAANDMPGPLAYCLRYPTRIRPVILHRSSAQGTVANNVRLMKPGTGTGDVDAVYSPTHESWLISPSECQHQFFGGDFIDLMEAKLKLDERPLTIEDVTRAEAFYEILRLLYKGKIPNSLRKELENANSPSWLLESIVNKTSGVKLNDRQMSMVMKAHELRDEILASALVSWSTKVLGKVILAGKPFERKEDIARLRDPNGVFQKTLLDGHPSGHEHNDTNLGQMDIVIARNTGINHLGALVLASQLKLEPKARPFEIVLPRRMA